MTVLQYLKWPFIIFLFGYLARFVGGLWKIRHWPMADEILTIGFIVCMIGIVFAIVKLLAIKKTVE